MLQHSAMHGSNSHSLQAVPESPKLDERLSISVDEARDILNRLRNVEARVFGARVEKKDDQCVGVRYTESMEGRLVEMGDLLGEMRSTVTALERIA